MNKRTQLLWILLAIALLFAFSAVLLFGSVRIPPGQIWQAIWGQPLTDEKWRVIVWQIRLPRAITAVLAGTALGVSGLQMQTLFRNALADPFVLGINAGASFGVALFVLAVSGAFGAQLGALTWGSSLGMAIAAAIGGGLVLLVVLALSQRLSPVTLLLIGLMVSYITGAGVSILLHFAMPERTQAYINWSFGNFGGVTTRQLQVMTPLVVLPLVGSLRLAKPLNALLLGQDYAQTLGVPVQRLRRELVVLTALLSGTITAFCGPIGFVGLAVPHIARNLFRTADHTLLLPACCLIGAILALVADIIAQLPASQYTLPLNAVTALIGAPIVLSVLLKLGIRE
ncbi:MAG TPA: iron ABC transporter permease [Anaerolineales bacterium]|nr:iron ABC transporter permease [Anaerolineales bacterium]